MTISMRGIVWRLVVILVGVAAVLLGYFWVHKPFDFALAVPFGGALLDLLTVALLVLIAGGTGRRALAWLDVTPVSQLERLALDAVVGLGLVSLAALALGLVGMFNGIILWGALVLVALILRASVRGWLGDVRAVLGTMRLAGGWTRFLAAVTLLLLVLALIRALAPPFAWDSLTYHLVAPLRYLAAGRIAAHADNHFLGLPQLAEVLYGVAMSPFGRTSTAALVHAAFGLFGLAAVFGLTRRYADSRAAWLAVVVLIGSYSVWRLFGWAYVDLAVFAYGAAVLVTVTTWRETRDSRWLVLTGVLLGMAMGVKYTSVGMALAVGVFVLVYAPRALVRNGLLIGGAAFVVFLPWMLKGALLYQNPVYPFVFDGLSWDAERAATFSTAGRGLLASGEAWQLAVLPFAATIFGIEGAPRFDFTAGAWLLTAPLLLLPCWALLDSRARRLARDCTLLGVPLLAFWIVLAATAEIGAQTRLLMMGLPLAAVLCGLAFHALAQFPEKPLHISFMVRALFALTLVLGVVEAARTTVRETPLQYLFGLETREAFLDANLGAHIGAMRALETLPAGSRVRLMWEPRSAYCPPNVVCQPDILFDHWAYPLRNSTSPDDVIAAWRDAGDYLLVWDAGYEISRDDLRFAAENRQFSDARERWLTVEWTDGIRYTLYTWNDAR